VCLHAHDFTYFADFVVELVRNKRHGGSDRLQIPGGLEPNSLPARNSDGFSRFGIDALAIFSRHDAETAESAQENFFAPGEPGFDGVKDQADSLLGIRVGHAPMRIINRFAQVILVHAGNSRKCPFNGDFGGNSSTALS
jgi:hypothetical protein